MASPPSRAPSTSLHQEPPKRTIRNEAPFPVYWAEVLDVGHQKWQPVDPLVTGTQWRPAKLEPPASVRDNSLVYAIAFEDDGTARDVTRRYAKAYNSKTRRWRVDGLADRRRASAGCVAPCGRTAASCPPTWTRSREAELVANDEREPMPRNIADFKDHPIYALERHLRRHELLVPSAAIAGTVSAGSRAPLQRIYRRRDVRVAYSADKWFRTGRVVRPDSVPAKWLPKKPKRKGGLYDDDGDDDDEEDPVLDGPTGTPIFTFERRTRTCRLPW